MASTLKELQKYMREQGYTIKRENGKHIIYEKGPVQLPLPRGNVTSTRFFDYLKQKIRHAELAAGLRTTLKG